MENRIIFGMEVSEQEYKDKRMSPYPMYIAE